jgi:MFS family permease
MAFLTVAVHAHWVAAIVVTAILAGAAQGLGQLGGLTMISTHVPAQRRAEANAVLNFGGYIPAALFPVGTGYLSDALGMATGTTIFATILAVAALSGGLLVWRFRQDALTEAAVPDSRQQPTDDVSLATAPR